MKIKTNDIRATFTKRMLSTGLSALLTLSPVCIQAKLETDPTAVTAFVTTYCEGLGSKASTCKTALDNWVKSKTSEDLSALAIELAKTVKDPAANLPAYIASCLVDMCNGYIDSTAKDKAIAKLTKAL